MFDFGRPAVAPMTAAGEGSRSSTLADVRFSISDTGIGIPKDQLDSIYSNFTQGDSSVSRKYGGSGMGLAIVKRLVDLMHGEISVASELGTVLVVQQLFVVDFLVAVP